jgi:hypothetical protein
MSARSCSYSNNAVQHACRCLLRMAAAYMDWQGLRGQGSALAEQATRRRRAPGRVSGVQNPLTGADCTAAPALGFPAISAGHARLSNELGGAGRAWCGPARGCPTVCLCNDAVRMNIRFCRGQGLPGLPWRSGILVRRACRTGPVTPGGEADRGSRRRG